MRGREKAHKLTSITDGSCWGPWCPANQRTESQTCDQSGDRHCPQTSFICHIHSYNEPTFETFIMISTKMTFIKNYLINKQKVYTSTKVLIDIHIVRLSDLVCNAMSMEASVIQLQMQPEGLLCTS